jgi:hypothetical protein
MLSSRWCFVRSHAETFRLYRTAMTTAEALIWHHGYRGLDAALKAAEAPTGVLREDVRAELWQSSRPIDTSASRTPTLPSGQRCWKNGAAAAAR